ncbi:KilA domain-containing protein [Pseudomonas protegens]|uniref:KilA-N domain-containing protein n=1 Tax=Pseudomonas TaxID=286 RepID=UPI000F4A2993|nr:MULTISPECIES: KilA-N domain-containing protein [Pseudomonas]MCS4261681.1 environmental stress-induced protein Ves [Pseudomonas sp. BIGb0176]ROQ51035.1 KilA domain-containing protein [Pseudomonas protegens]ROQ78522.1 KilA domain-containing protein [Pseudomonas protegens]
MKTRIIPFDYQGQAVTFNADGWINATIAAARFDKAPNDWLRLGSTEEYIEKLASRMSQSNTGKSRITLVTTRRGNTANSGTWLHSKLAVKFARWLSVDFEIWCDEQIDALVRGDQANWQQARQQSAVGYRGLCDALAIAYEENGKTPQRHHFINEAKLINQVITGQFAGRNRDQLTAHELLLVTLIEIRDVLLIGQGKDFAARKASLLRYIQSLTAKHLRSDAA